MSSQAVVPHPLKLAGRALPSGLAGFRGAHAGETILVCGCGSSLKDLKDPGRFISIGVNDIERLFTPTYLVVVNPRNNFSGDRFRFVQESKARAVFTQLDLGLPHPDVVRFKLGTRGGTDFSDPNVLHFTNNSPYVALCLAIHMGATRIGLIGVDFTEDHFFGKTGRHPLSGRLDSMNSEYAQLFRACSAMQIEVVNLSNQSRLTAIPKVGIDDFAKASNVPGQTHSEASSLRVVSYSTTPVAGVPAILARCITARTQHRARCVWARNTYGNGVIFQGDIEWMQSSREATETLEQADVVIVHNGKVDPQHQSLLATKPVVTMAHNYMWNVDQRFVQGGYPGVVVGQYQATLPEFVQWNVVPNPIPLWEPSYRPAPKGEQLTIAFTPSGRHERYPQGHRLYWHGKGFNTTMRVLERLAHRKPLRLLTTADHQVSQEQVLAMKQCAHIVIDECVTGSYHRNSLEGLAAACVVINGFGLLAGVREAFMRCAGDCPDWLFVPATLDDLEAKLEQLTATHTDVLCEQGRRGRAWMESHWDFRMQWESHWRPVVEQALDRSHLRRRTTSMNKAPVLAYQQTVAHQPIPGPAGLSVVVPFGGLQRLGLLATTVAALCQSTAVDQVIIVELGDRALATDIARRWGCDYLFISLPGPFDKARALNIGSTLAKNHEILWCDGDLLFGYDFLSRALQELRDRRLDFFFPFSRIEYLSEADSKEVRAGTRNPADCRALSVLQPMRGGAIGGVGLVRAELLCRFGGMIEGFLGWGGEDNAWVHKTSLLGRVGVTQRKDQLAYHLHHPDSGGIKGRPWRNNPYYQQNVKLLAEVQRIKTADELLQRFPVPAHWPVPWPVAKAVYFLLSAGGAIGFASALANTWAQRLLDLYGTSVPIIRCSSIDLEEECSVKMADAIIAFASDAVALMALRRAALLSRAIVILGKDESIDNHMTSITDAAWILAHNEGQIAKLRSYGRLVWHQEWNTTPVEARLSAPVVVQPLSMLLGNEQHLGVTAKPSNQTMGKRQYLPVWAYWEGPMPDWISSCLETVRWHAPTLRLLGPREFDALWDQDRDIDLSTLHVAQRADFVRAFLLMRFGGLWLDADCIVMRSLLPLLETLRAVDFVAHKERQGLFSNAFIAAAEGSAVARCFYEAVCARLRARKPLTWIALGNEPLTAVLNSTTVRWLQLRTEQVQPVCWSQPEVYFRQTDDTGHERSFDPEALCYMLSQQNLNRFQKSVTGAMLTGDRTFFSFLLRRARTGADAHRVAAPVDSLPEHAVSSKDAATADALGLSCCEPTELVPHVITEVFERMCQLHSVQGHESVSGPGSSLEQTAEIRQRLPLLLQELGVSVLLDAPCGDFNWMREVRLGIDTYIGIDLLEDLMQRNRERYSAPSRRFLALDILNGPLPMADVVLCRDCLVHLSFADIVCVLHNMRRSGSSYLLTTTFSSRSTNVDIVNGGWRPLNLQAAPFFFPPPLRLINEMCTESGGAFNDKCLGLWLLSDLPLRNIGRVTT